jgi:phosphoglycerate dehydrogenase-like enzyme
MPRPSVVVCAGKELFESFFPAVQQRRLGRLFQWQRDASRKLTPALVEQLATAQALITTWDSPRFSEDLLKFAPQLRIISHCGGEVKLRFARPLFDKLTITTAAEPMARATAELGAAFLLYCARNVDFYRDELRKRSNKIYQALHLHGATDSLIGREVAMIGFGRIGRALVDLLRPFDVSWKVYDPYAAKALARKYPIRFASLDKLLPTAHLLMLSAALTDETRGLLNREKLARLPDGATVINIARGGIIDLNALTKEVKRGRLRCALDVTDPLEPLPIGHALRKLPGAILTPHVAGSHRQVRVKMAQVVIDDLDLFFQGKKVQNRVTSAMLCPIT